MGLLNIFAEDLHATKINAGGIDVTAGRWPNGLRCGFLVQGTDTWQWVWSAIAGSPAPSYWFKIWTWHSSVSSSAGVIMTFGNSLAQYPFRLYNNTGTLQLQVWNSGTGTFVAVATATVPYTASLSTIVMKILQGGPSGHFELWQGDVKTIDYSGDLRGGALNVTSITTGFFGAAVSGGSSVYSGGIVTSNLDPSAMSLVALAPSGAGSASAWSGAYTDVNEVVENTANNITTNAAAQQELFAMQDLPSGNEGVIAVVTSARAIRGTSGPQNINMGIKIGGTTTFLTGGSIGTSYGPIQVVWENGTFQPGHVWSRADVNAMEAGVQSAV